MDILDIVISLAVILLAILPPKWDPAIRLKECLDQKTGNADD